MSRLFYSLLALLLSIPLGIAAENQGVGGLKEYDDQVFGFALDVPTAWSTRIHNYLSMAEIKTSAGRVTVLDQEFTEAVFLYGVYQDKINFLEISCAPYTFVDAATYQDYVTKFYEVSLSILKDEGVQYQYRAGADVVGNLDAFSLYMRILGQNDGKVIAETRSFNLYRRNCDYQISMRFNSRKSFEILNKALDSLRFK